MVIGQISDSAMIARSGSPMVEEAADRRLEVERHILVDDAVAEPLLGNLRGGDGPRRQHDVDAVVENALDQRHDGDGLADARRMDPDHRPFGALAAGDAIALAAADSVLLASGGAPGDIGARPADRRLRLRNDTPSGTARAQRSLIVRHRRGGRPRSVAALSAAVTSWRLRSISASSALAGTNTGAPSTIEAAAERQIDRGLVPAALQHLAAAGSDGEGQNRRGPKAAPGERCQAQRRAACHAECQRSWRRSCRLASDFFRAISALAPPLSRRFELLAAARAAHRLDPEFLDHQCVEFGVGATRHHGDQRPSAQDSRPASEDAGHAKAR